MATLYVFIMVYLAATTVHLYSGLSSGRDRMLTSYSKLTSGYDRMLAFSLEAI